MILSRLLPCLLIAAMMSTAQESLTISQLPIPFPPEDKPLCISVSEDGNGAKVCIGRHLITPVPASIPKPMK